MNIYYAVKVKFTYGTENGEKSKSEYTLVPAVSVGDAEEQAIKHYAEVLQFGDVSVVSVAPSQIVTVVDVKADDGKLTR